MENAMSQRFSVFRVLGCLFVGLMAMGGACVCGGWFLTGGSRPAVTDVRDDDCFRRCAQSAAVRHAALAPECENVGRDQYDECIEDAAERAARICLDRCGR